MRSKLTNEQYVEKEVQRMAKKCLRETTLIARERGYPEKEFTLMVVNAMTELPKLLAKHKITEW